MRLTFLNSHRKTITAGIFVGIMLFGAASYPADKFNRSRRSPLKGSMRGSAVEKVQSSFRRIYKLYEQSVVFISTERGASKKGFRLFDSNQRLQGLGTGFIISSEGYVCTNQHVVAGSDKVTVTVRGRNFEASIVGVDKLSDIALLKIKGSGNFKPVYFGDSDSVAVGDWSIAIGNPFGLDKTFTVGVISASGRNIGMELGDYIQTDATINPGNSGGPLINLDGEVVGVNRMIYSQSGGSMGIGFAIPINQALYVLNDLRKYGKVKRGYIGVQILMLNQEVAQNLGLTSNRGALVGTVLEGSPAARGGLKDGDVIIKADGKIIGSFQDLLRIVSRTPVGQTIRLQVWRNKSMVRKSITVRERPDN